MSQRGQVFPQIFPILQGPGKWDLLTAFGNANAGQVVEFQYFDSDSRMKLRTGATIRSLSHEGDSGEVWNLVAIVKMPAGHPGRISGYYNTRARNGHFTIIA